VAFFYMVFYRMDGKGHQWMGRHAVHPEETITSLIYITKAQGDTMDRVSSWATA